MSRRSYKRLSAMPSWGIYRSDKIQAACRAENLLSAKRLFSQHGYFGRIKKLEQSIDG